MRISAPLSLCMVLMGALVTFSPETHAGKEEAEQAVMDVMFGFDEIASEHYLFTVRPDGFVDLTLDDAITGDLLTRVLDELKSHPDIKGVLLTTSDICATPI